MRGKLCINYDYFLSKEAKILYLFSWTIRDAQKHF